MIKVSENGQEGGQGQAHAKGILAVLRTRLAKREVQNFFKLRLDCVPVDFMGNQGFGDLV